MTLTCTRLRHKIQDLIDAGKITDPEARKLNTQNNPLPNYRNAPPPDTPVLMIGTSLTEEQVFNSFVNVSPESTGAEAESLPQTEQPLELLVYVLDIWSSDDEHEGQVDLWKNNEAKESQ